MFNIGMPELILILIIALIVFGPGKLPEVSKALGRSIKEFRKAAEAASDSEKEGSAKTIDVKAEEMKAEGAKTESKADGKTGDK